MKILGSFKMSIFLQTDYAPMCEIDFTNPKTKQRKALVPCSTSTPERRKVKNIPDQTDKERAAFIC